MKKSQKKWAKKLWNGSQIKSLGMIGTFTGPAIDDFGRERWDLTSVAMMRQFFAASLIGGMYLGTCLEQSARCVLARLRDEFVEKVMDYFGGSIPKDLRQQIFSYWTACDLVLIDLYERDIDMYPEEILQSCATVFDKHWYIAVILGFAPSIAAEYDFSPGTWTAKVIDDLWLGVADFTEDEDAYAWMSLMKRSFTEHELTYA